MFASAVDADVIPENSALVDNWLLELSGRLLEDGTLGSGINEHDMEVQDKCAALLLLLDVIVLHDHIFFNPKWADAWDEKRVLNPIHVALRAIPNSVRDLQPQYSNMQTRFESQEPADDRFTRLVERGAIQYLLTANLLGLYYWPAPPRSEFLTQNIYNNSEQSFMEIVQRYLDSQIREIAADVLGMVGSSTGKLHLPGFGSRILSDCTSTASILSTAMEYRRTREVQAFRAWIGKMSNALRLGDIATVATGVHDLREVVDASRKSLGLEQKHNDAFSLSLGLSPSLRVEGKSFRAVLDRLKPKKLHLTFLRQHLNSCLEQVDVRMHFERLFVQCRD